MRLTTLLSISGLSALAVIGAPRLCFAHSASGTITTVAGDGDLGFSGDGSPATSAPLAAPNGLAVDNKGNLFIVDSGNRRFRKVIAADMGGAFTRSQLG